MIGPSLKTAAVARLPFLAESQARQAGPLLTTYEHRVGTAELAYTPASEPPTEGRRRAIFIFLPGNPGLVRYYDAFLATLSKASPPHVDLLCIGHVGHAPTIPPPPALESLDLEAQVQAKVELLDDVCAALGEDVDINLGGHSVGCWMAVEILKRRPRIRGLVLLFPTLSNIADTPNGRKLWPIFRPIAATILSHSSLLFRLAPTFLLDLLAPPPTVSLVRSPHVIRSALILGRSEMQTILDADLEFLGQQRDKIWAYYGKNDGWVEESEAQKIVGVLNVRKEESDESESPVQRVWQCIESIPHAFCLEHGELMAEKVGRWLNSSFSDDVK